MVESSQGIFCENNFITSNAQSGVELNGHALVSVVIMLRNKIPNGSKLFCQASI